MGYVRVFMMSREWWEVSGASMARNGGNVEVNGVVRKASRKSSVQNRNGKSMMKGSSGLLHITQ